MNRIMRLRRLLTSAGIVNVTGETTLLFLPHAERDGVQDIETAAAVLRAEVKYQPANGHGEFLVILAEKV